MFGFLTSHQIQISATLNLQSKQIKLILHNHICIKIYARLCGGTVSLNESKYLWGKTWSDLSKRKKNGTSEDLNMSKILIFTVLLWICLALLHCHSYMCRQTTQMWKTVKQCSRSVFLTVIFKLEDNQLWHLKIKRREKKKTKKTGKYTMSSWFCINSSKKIKATSQVMLNWGKLGLVATHYLEILSSCMWGKGRLGIYVDDPRIIPFCTHCIWSC